MSDTTPSPAHIMSRYNRTGVRYTIEFIGTLKGSDPTGEVIAARPAKKQKSFLSAGPTIFARDRQGFLHAWKAYPPRMSFTGKELYVRAVVRSDKPVQYAPDANAYKQEAWCQPVGWPEEEL